MPLTRVAVDGLSPLFIGSGRAVVAAALAIACLAVTRQVLPQGRQWARLVLVGGGVVVGFPLLTSFALTTVPASHGAVVAVLPAATAVMTVLRGHERPPAAFWVAAGAGAASRRWSSRPPRAVVGTLHWADLMLLGAVVAAVVGYAEGGLLAREVGAWQTVSWGLVLCAPLMVVLTVVSAAVETPHGTPLQGPPSPISAS